MWSDLFKVFLKNNATLPNENKTIWEVSKYFNTLPSSVNPFDIWLLLLLLYTENCTSWLLFIIRHALRLLEKLKLEQDGVVAGSLLSTLSVHAIVIINLFLLEWNSNYLTSDAWDDLLHLSLLIQYDLERFI